MQAGETQPKASTRRNTFAFEYARLKDSSQGLEFNAQMRGETDLKPWWTPASAWKCASHLILRLKQVLPPQQTNSFFIFLVFLIIHYTNTNGSNGRLCSRPVVRFLRAHRM